MELEGSSRRRAERHQGEGIVKFEGQQAIVVNVSASGLAIKTKKDLSELVGKSLTFSIEFDLPVDSEEYSNFELTGSIRYCRGQGGSSYYSGVMLDDMDADQRSHFERFLILLWEAELSFID